MVNTNDSEGKIKARDELYKFIRKHYTAEQLQNLKILTLISDKPYELEQVWDKLGVPRQNITTVERNPEVREKIKKNHSGIRVIESYSSIDEFIGDTKEQFDIINLDYCGNFTPDQLDTLQNISSKRMLKDKGILATWYSGRREKETTKNFLKSTYLTILEALHSTACELTEDKQELEAMNALMAKGIELSKTELDRSESITSMISSCMANPLSKEELEIGEKDLPKIIKLLNGEENVVSTIEKSENYTLLMKELLKLSSNEALLKETVGEKLANHYLNVRRKAIAREQPNFNDRLALAMQFIETSESLKAMKDIIRKWAKNEMGKKTVQYGQNLPNLMENVALVLLLQTPQYLVFDNERLFYHGDHSTPMFVDFTLFGKKDFKDFYWFTKNGKLRFNAGTLTHFGYREVTRLNEYATLLKNSNIMFMNDRKNLDSKTTDTEDSNTSPLENIANSQDSKLNQKESTAQNIVTKEQIYTLLQQGKSVDEIHDLHPEYSKKRIGSYKAWITMKEGKDENPKSDSLSSTLSREDAIMLLHDGHTPQEIADVFKVPIWKIRGYQAGITRKLNKEKEQYNKAS